MSAEELALEILKGRVRDRDATIAELRAEVERLTTQASVAGEYQVRWMTRAQRAEADLAEAVAVVQALVNVWDTDELLESVDSLRRDAIAALLAKVKP